MSAEKRKEDVQKIAELLKRFDSDTVLAAIKQAEVDYAQVNEIKSLLSKYSPMAVECALEEMKTDKMNFEIKKVEEIVAQFGLEETKQAAVAIGIADKLAMCIDTINCRGNCVMVMIVRCGQEMVALTKKWEWVQQDRVERGIARATALAQKMGEI